jgi:xanthine dehydrogenase accessory factor
MIVASHGVGEEDALVEALEAGVGYVALVASPKRGRAVLEALNLDPALVHTPAGLDIDARTPADVAISILAELIASRTAKAPEPVSTAIDPVCGMEVLASEASLHLDVDSTRFYFCCDGCRTSFAKQHSLS